MLQILTCLSCRVYKRLGKPAHAELAKDCAAAFGERLQLRFWQHPQLAEQRVDSEQIAAPAEAGNLAHADGRKQRFVPEFLARVDIREMHLDDGQRNRADGIT